MNAPADLKALSQAASNAVQLTRAADLTMTKTDWLWRGWLAAGKLQIVAGPPGTGKTTIALAVAATVTNGGLWPDSSRCAKAGSVLVWSGEDDPSDTLGPRLKAAGADLSKVYFITGLADGAFDPSIDMLPLTLKAREIPDLRLLILDPLTSAVSGDSHKNSEVRKSLEPVVRFAQETGAAVLGIAHFSKGGTGADPLSRVNGSIAFGALARLVWGAAKAPGDGDTQEKRVLVRLKSNIGADGGGFAYDLQPAIVGDQIETSRVVWGASLEGSAREILGDTEQQDNDGDDRADIEAFVTDLLSAGPITSKAFEAESRAAGFEWRTVKRRAKKIAARSTKDGMAGGWRWSISGAPKWTKSPEVVEVVTQKDSDSSATSDSSMSTSGLSRVIEVEKINVQDAEVI